MPCDDTMEESHSPLDIIEADLNEGGPGSGRKKGSGDSFRKGFNYEGEGKSDYQKASDRAVKRAIKKGKADDRQDLSVERLKQKNLGKPVHYDPLQDTSEAVSIAGGLSNQSVGGKRITELEMCNCDNFDMVHRALIKETMNNSDEAGTSAGAKAGWDKRGRGQKEPERDPRDVGVGAEPLNIKRDPNTGEPIDPMTLDPEGQPDTFDNPRWQRPDPRLEKMEDDMMDVFASGGSYGGYEDAGVQAYRSVLDTFSFDSEDIESLQNEQRKYQQSAIEYGLNPEAAQNIDTAFSQKIVDLQNQSITNPDFPTDDWQPPEMPRSNVNPDTEPIEIPDDDEADDAMTDDDKSRADARKRLDRRRQRDEIPDPDDTGGPTFV